MFQGMGQNVTFGNPTDCRNGNQLSKCGLTDHQNSRTKAPQNNGMFNRRDGRAPYCRRQDNTRTFHDTRLRSRSPRHNSQHSPFMTIHATSRITANIMLAGA